MKKINFNLFPDKKFAIEIMVGTVCFTRIAINCLPVILLLNLISDIDMVGRNTLISIIKN